MRHALCILVLLAGVALGQTLVELLEGTIVYEDERIAVIVTDLPAQDVKALMATLGVPHPKPKLRIETGDGFNLYYSITVTGHVLDRESRVGVPPPLADDPP
jgi:hypothetical protein